MIKSVIFDLSEVLIPGLIGIETRLEQITGISSDIIAKSLGSYPYHEPGNNLESLLKGEITYQDYREGVGFEGHYEQAFDRECLKMFESPYSHTEEMIQRTSESCDLYLLSDHCEIWANHILEKHDFLRFFKGALWSYEVSATKKSRTPFVALINRYGLIPEECLFVDDNHINISIAGDMGFNTVHFLGEESVNEVYRAIENA